MDAAARLVDNSEGVAFVYTKFVYSGLLPMITVLEHRGYRMLGMSRPITELPGGAARPNGHRFIVLSNLAMSRNSARDIAAVKSSANVDGSRVKVVLGTRVAVEGYDLAFIRSVHVLDPWFNMSLVRQVVGRASRHCSHRHLPLARRNATVYLHVATHPDGTAESEDVRAYMIAEEKHRGIARVERQLKEHAIDCHVNRDASVFPVADIGISVPLVTSQGTAVAAFPLGDADGSIACDLRACRYRCLTSEDDVLDDRRRTTVGSTRVSLALHADQEADVLRYMGVVMMLFRKVDTVFERHELRRHVAKSFPALDDNVLLETLRRLVQQQVPVRGPRSAWGHIKYVGDAFVFQTHSAHGNAPRWQRVATLGDIKTDKGGADDATTRFSVDTFEAHRRAVVAVASRHLQGVLDDDIVMQLLVETRLTSSSELLGCVAYAYKNEDEYNVRLRAALVAVRVVLGLIDEGGVAVFDFFQRRIVVVDTATGERKEQMKGVAAKGVAAPAKRLLLAALHADRDTILAKDRIAIGLHTLHGQRGVPILKLRLSNAKASMAQRVRAGTDCETLSPAGAAAVMPRVAGASSPVTPVPGDALAAAPRGDRCVAINLWLRHLRRDGVSLVFSHWEYVLYPHVMGLQSQPAVGMV
jgi:hypothetical protein